MSHLNLFVENEIATIRLDVDDRSANMISNALLDELNLALDKIEANEAVKGIILSSTKSTFVVGADLDELLAHIDLPDSEIPKFFQNGQDTFCRFTKLAAVSVAVIDGACVGGGAELASWCDFRVISDSPKTIFGFPEVQLGLTPGWGGTAIAPRMVDAKSAIELIATGTNLSGHKAHEMGFAEIATSENLLAKALTIINAESNSKSYLENRTKIAQPLSLNQAEKESIRNEIQTKISASFSSGNPAPAAVLNLMLDIADLPLPEALAKEKLTMARLFGSPENRGLLNLFFLRNGVKKDNGLDHKTGIEPKPINDVGIAGAGVMGEGITTACLKRRLNTQLYDVNSDIQNRCADKIHKTFNQKPRVLESFKTASQIADLSQNDLLIETIVENKDIKLPFLAELEKSSTSETLIGSNTSTIPITKLAESLQRPENFCGIHFFYPVKDRPLVEIIRGEKTSDHSVASVVQFTKRLGKIPIVVKDGPGFLVNRLLFPYSNESMQLIEDGIAFESIENAATDFGMPVGPLTLSDQVGLDTAVYSGTTIVMAFYNRIAKTRVLQKLVKAKRLGVKSNAGFFKYENHDETTQQPDPSAVQCIAKCISDQPLELTNDQITMRLFLPMLVEATRILEERLVRKPADIDLGLMLGLGFPDYRGGLLFWADQIGPKEILNMLKPFSELGERYHPTELMKTLAESNGKYYELF